ncbi:ABC transporter permease [Paenibacillus lentus]|uniref:Permease n=1 Tax=Paenibacillus lentus TaxID=1338368 RepID=A0A3S8S139_9BACL|nr:ABC transporter permease [Paenibacillus lentus]AZK48847.1 permease [Paenibacillus lentus]
MLLRSLHADFLKIHRKGIWFLIFLAPIGLVTMQGLNFGLRSDYLFNRYKDNLWGGLIYNIELFVPMALFLGCTLISSLVANVEHQMSSWKQLLALPISRSAVFLSKFTLCVLLLTASCLLLPLCTAGLGFILGFGPALPVQELLSMGFYPYLAAWPLLALQLWLSLTLRNQALPVSTGVAAAIISPFTVDLSAWLPLNWPTLALGGDNPLPFIIGGTVLGLFIMLISLLHFNRKDVD